MSDPKRPITIPTTAQPFGTTTVNGQQYRLVPDQVWLQFLEQMQRRLNDHETRIAALEP